MYPIPILFLIYKRKKLALKTFSQIAKQKPKSLYIFSDFNENKEIQERIYETRKAIISKVNWKCELKTYFSKKNIGIKYYQKEALDWVLNRNREEYVIYIEDDIYCSDDFFKFQKDLLPRYKDNKKIIGITGFNFGFKSNIKNTYFLSRFGWSWGIGFYKRVLKFYDPDVKDYLSVKKQDWYKKRFIDYKSYFYLDTYLTKIAKHDFVAADLQIYYAAFRYDKYFIVSTKKLVENLGFNVDGHNPFIFSYKSSIEKIDKIIHPKKLTYSKDLEKGYYKRIFVGGWLRLILIRIYLNLPIFLKSLIDYLVKVIKF